MFGSAQLPETNEHIWAAVSRWRRSSFDLCTNLFLRVWELFTEEIYFTDSLCTMKHLLLPAQVEKVCFRQWFSENVLVPPKHKEAKKKKKSINSLLSVLCLLVDVCNVPFNESKWEKNVHLWAYPSYIFVSAAVKTQQEETSVHYLSTVDTTVFHLLPCVYKWSKRAISGIFHWICLLLFISLLQSELQQPWAVSCRPWDIPRQEQ